MTTRTKNGRAASAGQGGFARSASTLRRRREPEPSGLKKLAGGVRPASKDAPRSKKGKAGGFALAAAAAGMAFKNRGKLAQLRRRRSA